jgi:hypothetical protein
MVDEANYNFEIRAILRTFRGKASKHKKGNFKSPLFIRLSKI